MTDGPATSAELDPTLSTIAADLWPDFMAQIPQILASQDRATGTSCGHWRLPGPPSRNRSGSRIPTTTVMTCWPPSSPAAKP